MIHIYPDLYRRSECFFLTMCPRLGSVYPIPTGRSAVHLHLVISWRGWVLGSPAYGHVFSFPPYTAKNFSAPKQCFGIQVSISKYG
jgi:hypothetical protein